MGRDIITLLKNCAIFSSLDNEAYEEMVPLFQAIELKAHETLFARNDPSDALFVLISGELSVILETDEQEVQIIGTIKPGEPVGELGALSDAPRSLTIKASQASKLLKLDSLSFRNLCQKNPSILFEILNPIISRSQKTIQLLGSEKAHEYSVIASVNQETSLEGLKQTIRENAKENSIILFSEKDIESPDFEKTMDERSKNYKHVFLCLDSLESKLKKMCLEHANNIYFVAEADSKYKVDDFIVRLLKDIYFRAHKKCELVLLHPNSTLFPQHTNKWLETFDFLFHHHIRLSNPKDCQRLLRFMTKKPIGLVLGGGAGKGWLHMGIIKALLEKDIPIDMVGGTSVGGIAGACYLFNQTYDDMCNNFSKIVEGATRATTIQELTWPTISVMSAKHGTEAVQQVFASFHIEDLWIPFFCVSSNLSTSTADVHREGLLWKKIRASASLPGIVPPMVINGQLHCDGGLLNNLPVDIMKGFVGASGKIIAVKLFNRNVDKTQYYFPPVLTPGALLVEKWFKKKNYVFPPMFDTLLKAFLLGSSAKEGQNALLADYLIDLDLTEFRPYHMTKTQETELIQMGYQEMCSILKKWSH